MITRVVVADALGVFRAAVRRVLEAEKDIDVGEAGSLAELRGALALGADVAVLDAALPPAGGLAGVELAALCCEHVIVWSLRPSREDVVAAIRAGATGYLRKTVSPTVLVRSIRGAARGEAPMQRDLVAMLIAGLHDLQRRDRARASAADLSDREREVLGLVARGERNKQIAAALTISEFTVKRHVQNILQKLEVGTRRDAAALYASLGAGS